MKPLLMGIAMGLMMMGMLHSYLTGTTTLTGWAAALFIGAHLALVLAALSLALFAVRLSPAIRNRLSRLHRPSLRHMALMLAGMGLTGLAIHIIAHGGIA